MSLSPYVRTIPFALTALLAVMLAAACAGQDTPARPEAILCPPSMTQAAQQAICIRGLCGNAVIDPGETCDDGNRIAGDGCSADCQSAELCGNGIIDTTVGEVCDDGNIIAGDTCCSDCRSCPELAMLPPSPAASPTPEPTNAPATPPCSEAQLRQALASIAHQAHPPTAAQTATRAGTAGMPRAGLQPRSAAQELQDPQPPVQPNSQPHARSEAQLQQALGTITKLQRANASLEQALAAERQALAELRNRLTSGRGERLQ